MSNSGMVLARQVSICMHHCLNQCNMQDKDVCEELATFAASNVRGAAKVGGQSSLAKPTVTDRHKDQRLS